MPDITLPLDDLTQQIAQRQSELEGLRQEYEARQASLANLAQAREELQTQLRQVEAEIYAVTQGQAPAALSPQATPMVLVVNAEPERMTLTEALVELVREAGRPLTARELSEELTRRNYPTTSVNFTNLVQNRLSDLVKRGILRRADGEPGVLLANPSSSAKTAGPKARPATQTLPAEEVASPHPTTLRNGQPSLRSLLTDLLRKSRKPMAAKDLAAQVLATGYQTKSAKFTDVVWTALGQLEGVENVKGEGWRLIRD